MKNKSKENQSNITNFIEEIGEVEEMQYNYTINNTLKLLFNIAKQFQVKAEDDVIVTMSSAKYKKFLKFLEKETNI